MNSFSTVQSDISVNELHVTPEGLHDLLARGIQAHKLPIGEHDNEVYTINGSVLCGFLY